MDLIIPKNTTCHQDKCGCYTLVLQHGYSKCVWVRTVYDKYMKGGISPNPFLYRISIDISLPKGQYTYYLCKHDRFTDRNILYSCVENSMLQDYIPIAPNGQVVRFGNHILVERRADILLHDNGQVSIINNQAIIGDLSDTYQCGECKCIEQGDLYRKIAIIATGVMDVCCKDKPLTVLNEHRSTKDCYKVYE